MGATNVLEPVLLERVRAVLEAGPPLALAVLFGSRASGRTRADSDVDLGIVPIDPKIALADELALASTLSSVFGAEVDLVRLDGDNPLLGREVARTGVCVFERSAGAFAAFRAGAMSRWIDFDETVSPLRVRLLRRLAAGT